MEPIKIQDWGVPRLGPSTHRMVHRGYVEFFRKRGIDVSNTFRDAVLGGVRAATKKGKGKRRAKQQEGEVEE